MVCLHQTIYTGLQRFKSAKPPKSAPVKGQRNNFVVYIIISLSSQLINVLSSRVLKCLT